jgi:hypothetical protein
MKSAGVRLGLAAALFVAWIGWLAYLAAKTSHPIVLSRPQFLVSNFDVSAEVTGGARPDTKVTIKKAHWPQNEPAQKMVGQTIEVSNLTECEGWKGPGLYILALTTDWEKSFRVTPTPRSPGYEAGKPFIYPETPETLAQLREIHKPEAQPKLK